MNPSKIWHCARPRLAASYLEVLGSGLAVSTSIFAPRRTGKTVFLLQDLAPAARAAGYAVAYADLWQTRLNPGIALIKALEEALEPRTLGERAMRKLKEPVKKVKAKGSLGEFKGEVEVELAEGRKASTEMALRIDELVSQIVARKPLLLLVDEAQELARSKDNELMATALRTAMTKHRDAMRVIFTGSSRTQLAHVFKNADAPLYSVGGSIQDFPLLGRELVEYVAGRFEKASGRKLDVAKAWVAFQDFRFHPEPFLSAVIAMLMDPRLKDEKAYAMERAEQDKEENHDGTWAALNPMQQQVLRLVVREPLLKPFSQATRSALGKALGVGVLEASSVQYAVNDLALKNVVTRSPQGVFRFENHAFERWVKTLAPQ